MFFGTVAQLVYDKLQAFLPNQEAGYCLGTRERPSMSAGVLARLNFQHGRSS